MKFKSLFLSISLVLIFFTIEIFGNEFTIRSYRIEDGLPSLRINEVLQDNSGLMWFASDNEIFTYDGHNWEIKYSSDKTDDPHYKKLLKDEKGKIWALPVYWEHSIIYYDGTTWESLPPIGGSVNKNVYQNSIAIKYNEGETEVYVGTEEDGIFLFKNEKWVNLSFPILKLLTKINDLKLVNGKLYAASDLGLHLYDTNSEVPEFVKIVSGNILKFCIENLDQTNSEEHKIWLLGDDWIGSFEEEKLTILSNKIDLFDLVYKVEVDNEFIYVATKQQLSFINKEDGTQGFLNGENFYSRDGANSIFIDREKNIWAANNRGVHKIRKSLFANYDSKNSLLENEVTAIEFFDDGTVLLGHNNGLSLVNDDGIKTIDFMGSLPITENHSRILSTTLSENGNILFASQNYGVGEIDKKGNINWYRFEKDNYDFFSIHRDSKGDVWLSCKFNIYKLENGRWQKSNLITEKFFKEKDWIRIISSTKKGVLLLGTSLHGIIIFDEGAKKIVSSEIASGNDIFSIYENKNGDIFAGTLDGLYIVKNNNKENINM